jgi:hypothetical protein
MRRTVSFLLARQKWAAFAICGYEAVAISTGRTPTVTALCGRYRPLAPALILALAVHLARPDQPLPRPVASGDDCLLCPEPF